MVWNEIFELSNYINSMVHNNKNDLEGTHMRCKNCSKFIWYWNKWRKYPFYSFDRHHVFNFEEVCYVCSEKCYLKCLKGERTMTNTNLCKSPKKFRIYLLKAKNGDTRIIESILPLKEFKKSVLKKYKVREIKDKGFTFCFLDNSTGLFNATNRQLTWKSESSQIFMKSKIDFEKYRKYCQTLINKNKHLTFNKAYDMTLQKAVDDAIKDFLEDMRDITVKDTAESYSFRLKKKQENKLKR